MKLELTKIVLDNFKGVKHQELTFDGNTLIKGQNGAGKSTVATAWLWLFTDTDITLVKGPNITPLGETEVESRVEVECLVDGKPLNLTKSQKYKTKEVDGKLTTSVTNSYEVNSIKKTLKDFIASLEERGIDTEHFLILSNPNALLADTSKAGREKIREILFSMTGDISDTDIAKGVKADDVVELLDNYTLAEIEQMHKATIKKITDSMGKDNSIINARIDELLSQKSTQDSKVLEEQKKSYEAEIDRIDKELSGMSGTNEKLEKLQELANKQMEIKARLDSELATTKAEMDKPYRRLNQKLMEIQFKVNEAQAKIDATQAELDRLNEDIKKQRTLYKMEQDSMLDESDLSCPVCHRSYDAEKLETIKADFTKNKAKRLKTIKASGDELKAQIKANNETLQKLTSEYNEYNNLLNETQALIDSATAELNSMPLVPDYDSDKEYAKVSKDIEKLRAELAKPDNTRKNELESQKNVNKQMLNQVISELAFLDKNKELDKRVEELREERKTNEVNKAKAEKIIDQVENVKRHKNEKLTDEINKHFDIIDWKLFEYQRNGDIKEVCIPLIDGKPIDSCCNGSLITLAKVSICNTLQNHFGQFVPIWIDDYSLFSENTYSRLEYNTQIIGLMVTENKELVVE